MGVKGKHLFRNLSYSLLANFILLLTNALTVLLIPGLWGKTAYDYFQLYLFYSSYIGLFHLGWVDGIYLRIGGKKYEEIDKPLYTAQVLSLFFFSILIALVIAFASGTWVSDPAQAFVWKSFGICLVVYLPVTFFSYLFQATNRIREYAEILAAEKLLFAVCLLVLLLSGRRDFQTLVYADLLSKLAALGFAYLHADGFSTVRGVKPTVLNREIKKNISVGYKLMLANLSGMLMIGIIRYAIKAHWGVGEFGKVSFSLSLTNFFLTFISAAGIALFPILRNVGEDRKAEVYGALSHLMMPVLFLLLFFCRPMQEVFWRLFPAYTDSVRYLAVLLPFCVLESKMALLVNTYFKVLRKEKQLLVIQLSTVCVSVGVAWIFVYQFSSLILTMCGIVMLSALRLYLSEWYLSGVLGFSLWKEMTGELLLVVGFILAAWLWEGWAAWVCYGAFYLFYLWSNRKEILDGMNSFRERA